MQIQNPVHSVQNYNVDLPKSTDILVVGSGMGALCAAVLLVQNGYKVVVCEQNYLPGGCSSSYLRQGNIFESGATTLVGLDSGMPLAEVLKKTGISFEAWRIDLPMEVRLSDGTKLMRHPQLNDWIAEAERVFGLAGQRSFWEECYRISQLVWSVSSRQTHFPPDRFSDLFEMIKSTRIDDLALIPYFFSTVKSLLIKHGLENNERFIKFVDEQLMITAQNKHKEVNTLFGATALCYTLQGNYYVPGGMISMVKAFTDFIVNNGSVVSLKTDVKSLARDGDKWRITTSRGEVVSKTVLSGIPVNNLMTILDKTSIDKSHVNVLPVQKLNGAIQVGIVFRSLRRFTTLHYQLHHTESFPVEGSGSLFLSISHPDDRMRSIENEYVASVSTHCFLSSNKSIDKEKIREMVLNRLVQEGFFELVDVLYSHISDSKDWEDWTKRFAGFVGGYPQFKNIPPWRMNSGRISEGFYLCGDSAYPGQGIPGAALSGLIAFEKLHSDSKQSEKKPDL
jgi:phytoene dehydrogenase-like protein